jgi:hypothetical protein
VADNYLCSRHLPTTNSAIPILRASNAYALSWPFQRFSLASLRSPSASQLLLPPGTPPHQLSKRSTSRQFIGVQKERPVHNRCVICHSRIHSSGHLSFRGLGQEGQVPWHGNTNILEPRKHLRNATQSSQTSPHCFARRAASQTNIMCEAHVSSDCQILHSPATATASSRAKPPWLREIPSCKSCLTYIVLAWCHARCGSDCHIAFLGTVNAVERRAQRVCQRHTCLFYGYKGSLQRPPHVDQNRTTTHFHHHTHPSQCVFPSLLRLSSPASSPRCQTHCLRATMDPAQKTTVASMA